MFYRFTKDGVEFYFDTERLRNGQWAINRFTIANDGIREDSPIIKIVTFENDLKLNKCHDSSITSGVKDLLSKYEEMLDLLSGNESIPNLNKVYKHYASYCIVCEGAKSRVKSSITFCDSDISRVLTDVIKGRKVEEYDAVVFDNKEKVEEFFQIYETFMEKFIKEIKPLLLKEL